MDRIHAAFSANVRHLRDKRGWSQEELAEKSGLHRTYISGIERGVRNPTLSIIDRLAKALGVPASELLKWCSE
jgi:transcriptional regulator with XRE-family HTH domain